MPSTPFAAPTPPPFTFASRRSPVYARGGMVAASQPLAVEAGLSALRAGGGAADAAVATAAALAVLEPCSTGLGGDAFVLYFDAASRRVHALNGSGRCAAALSIDLLAAQGITGEIPKFHAHTVTVPGACAAWCDLWERFGSLGLATLLYPAIRLAREGFAPGPITAELWARGVPNQLSQSRHGGELLLDGRAPRMGECMRNPALADTLEEVATGGKDAFYQGRAAARIVAAVREAGGLLAEADLAAHRSEWTEPASTVFRGVRVHECPPNGQGVAALIALNILSACGGLDGTAPLGAERLHLMIEAMRLAFADVRRHVADPAMAAVPLAGLLDPAYAAARAKAIDPRRAMPRAAPGQPSLTPPANSDTVYFCAVDSQGNACSMVNSNYMGFGTGLVPQGCGFSLQNRGHNFSLDPAHPNALAPGKRPYHTIIPGMAVREADGALFAPFGVMGGFMQPQGHVQVLVNMLCDGDGPQEALDRPRWCIQPEVREGRLALEEGVPEATCAALADLGHGVERVAGHARSLFGRGQIILRDPVTGMLCAGSDPRADGCAFGL